MSVGLSDKTTFVVPVLVVVPVPPRATASVPVVTPPTSRSVIPEPFPDMVPFTLTLIGFTAAVCMVIVESDALSSVYPISSVSVDSSKIMPTLLDPDGRVITRPRSTIGEAVLSFPSSMIGS